MAGSPHEPTMGEVLHTIHSYDAKRKKSEGKVNREVMVKTTQEDHD